MPTDSLHVLDSIAAFPDQCRQVLTDLGTISIPSECSLVHHVLVAGMGGSALGARVLASVERQTLKVPLLVSTEFTLPSFVGEHSLVIISSYSGNTAESISALHEARARNAKVFVLTAGGELAKLAETYKLPAYVFDPKFNLSHQPRMGIMYNVLGLIGVLSRCQLIQTQDNLSDLPQYLTSLQSENSTFKTIAKQLVGRISLIISSEHLKGAAHALRNQLNENAKSLSLLADLPELNHHLLEGLAYPKDNPERLIAFALTSSFYTPSLVSSYPKSLEVFKKHHIPVISYSQPAAPSRLYEAIGLVQLGAYLAYYLAAELDIDPGPIPWVDWFKDQLKSL